MTNSKYAILLEEQEPNVVLELDETTNQVKLKLFDTRQEADEYASERFSMWSIVQFTKAPYTCAGGATYDIYYHVD